MEDHDPRVTSQQPPVPLPSRPTTPTRPSLRVDRKTGAGQEVLKMTEQAGEPLMRSVKEARRLVQGAWLWLASETQ